jgi:hypothetical protein
MADIQLNIEPSESLGSFLTNTFGDKYLYAVNRDSFNKVGTQAIYNQRFQKHISRENSLFVIIGTDSGLLLKYLLKNELPGGSRFLFVELPQVILRLEEVMTLTELPEQISLNPYDNWLEKAEDFRIRDYLYLNNVTLLTSIATDDGFIPEYLKVFAAVQDDLRQLAWNTKLKLGGEAFVLRQFENVSENRISGASLKNLFLGKTAVLMAGGPSLDDIFPWVKENRAKIVLIAVSRVCRRLREVNITPDIIVSLDPHPASFDISKEMLYFWKNTLFINGYHVFPSLLGQWRGRSVFLGPRFPWETPLNVENLSMPGPTVANAAISVAGEMGFSQIILAGLDLCFKPDGQTYAKGSDEFDSGPKIGKSLTTVMTNGGWQAETIYDFKASITIVGQQAEQALKRGCRIINPAPIAAQVPNVEFLDIDAINVNPIDELFISTIDKVLPANTQERRRQHYDLVAKELTRAFYQLVSVKNLAQKALRCNNGLFGRNGLQANFKYKKKMDRIEKELNRKYKSFTQLIKQFGLRDFLKLTRPDPNKEWEDEEIEQTGRIYYETMSNSADKLMELINKAKDRVHTRIEEETKQPDFLWLFSQWRKDQQPGRVLVFKDNHPELTSAAEPTIQAEIKFLENEFQKILTERETEHKKYSNKESSLSGVRSKALILFKQKDEKGLEKLSSLLTGHQEKNSAILQSLTKGYLAELKGKTAVALKNYQHLMTLVDEHDPILEDVLKRISLISLRIKDTANALTALECLAAISPLYMPQFANLFSLLGKHQQALTVYADYLERVPNDIVTMLKISRYYMELGMPEGAKMVLELILKQEPDNNAAQTLWAQTA